MSDASHAVPTWRVAALAGRADRPDSPEILVAAASEVALPVVPHPIEIDPFAADAVAAVEALLGVPVVPLRLTWLPGPDWRSGWVVVEVEPLVAAPAGYGWRDAAAVRDALEPAEARATVARWMDRWATGAPPFEPPWARAGWFGRASAWMAERMAESGRAPSEPPRLAYQGPLGAVLRARHDGHAAFLKCAAPVFAHEASITHAIARHAPGAVPEVIASEPAENWLLMADHGGRLLGLEPEAAWIGALPRVAALHRAWTGTTSKVRAAGARHRPLADLAAALPSTLDRGLGVRLPAEVREGWQAALPRLLDACAALEGLGLPDTLIHGDLHPGNVVVGPDGPVLVDWSDAAVSHPFIDLPTYLIRTKDAALRRRMWDAYLDAWDGVRPREQLEAAAAHAMAVGSAYQVETYLVLLASTDEPDAALFTGADVSWAKRTLDALDRGLDVGLA